MMLGFLEKKTMQKKTIIETAIIGLIALALMFGLASATVTFTVSTPLFYDNGSSVFIAAGTYDTVEKIDNVWYVNGDVYPPAYTMPNPTAPPSVTASPIGLTEIVLLVIFLFFTVLGFGTKEPVVFVIAAFSSIVFGLILALRYIGDTSAWAFGLTGFMLVIFGFGLILLAATTANKGGKKK